MNWSHQYNLPESFSTKDIARHLKTLTSCEIDGTQLIERIFYDTFDWRLYTSETVMEERRTSQGDKTLLIRPLQGTIRYASETTFKKPVCFVHDLPEGHLKRQLEPLVEMRALLAVARIRSRITSLRLLDKRKKTVSILVLEDSQILNKTSRTKEKSIRHAELIAIKGYGSATRQCSHILSKELGFHPIDKDILTQALESSGRYPPDYSSKLDFSLDPGMRADDAVRLILGQLLDIIQANENGVRKVVDSEHLHDFRVAVRRARSAIAQIKGVLPDRKLSKYRRGLQWLQRMSGAARDIDVHLLKFEDYRKLVDPTFRSALAPLREYLEYEKNNQYGSLIQTLDSTRYKNIIANWREFLHQPILQNSIPENAATPIYVVASQRIWRLYRRAMKEGKAIKDDSPAAALHELRKTCKKLRYMLEFFQSMYTKQEIKKLIGSLKQLQDILGDFNDLQVQSKALRGISKKMHANGLAGPETLMAVGALIEALGQQEHIARGTFHDRFAKFSTPNVAALFRRLFHNKTPTEP